MAIKKSELYNSLWASCDELRGGMDASQYKDYVLVLLFIKYISDKYAGVPYILRSLKSKGKGAVILPRGVLFRGNAECDIRTNIIRRGYIKGIIGLPANLFYGTGIPACIIVLDKENSENRKAMFMIDASKGFEKDGNKNRLREQDIHKIVDVFNKQVEIEKYSRMVSVTEIEANDEVKVYFEDRWNYRESMTNNKVGQKEKIYSSLLFQYRGYFNFYLRISIL